jgi:hypothetical protein
MSDVIKMRTLLLLGISVSLSACSPASKATDGVSQQDIQHGIENPAAGDLDFYSGDFSAATVIGNSLPGTWRPFSTNSPWNTVISDNTPTYPESKQIMEFIASRARHVRLINSYLIPIWVVNSENARSDNTTPTPTGNGASQTVKLLPTVTLPVAPESMDLRWVRVRSKIIFDTWDQNRDGLSDVPLPLAKRMYAEPNEDGHICVVDPFKKVSYEMSRYYGWKDGLPECTTFNIWDLTGEGVGNPREGERWWARGGRGSGFPIIAGMVRPEELMTGNIRHALLFTFGDNRKAAGNRNIMIHPPACRSDGRKVGSQYPIEGMRFQLNSELTDSDFDQWNLTREGKILARALQEYGMFLSDNGGDMAIAVQLLGPTQRANRRAWDTLFPGFYKCVDNIPINQFRIVDTVKPTLR